MRSTYGDINKQSKAGHPGRRNNMTDELNALDIYMSQVGQHPLLSPEDEVELAKAAGAGDEKARQRLINGNLRLVIFFAKKYHNQNHRLDMLDLIQEGNIGLVKAVDKFNWQRGFRFSTYASRWITSYIQRAIDTQNRPIRIPSHAVETLRSVVETDIFLTQQLGRLPSYEEIAEAADVGVSDVDVVFRTLTTETVSIHDTLGYEEDDGLSAEDLYADPNAIDPADAAMHGALSDALVEALTVLDERERAVVIARYGLDGGDPKTLMEVGAVLGMSFSGIRKVESRALDKLSKQSLGLESFLYA